MNARFSTGCLTLALGLVVTAVQAQMPLARKGTPIGHNLPPAQMLMEPGPGVGGPGPGVLAARRGPDIGHGASAMYGPFGAVNFQPVQILFDRPELMTVQWDVSGVGMYDSAPLVVPGRQNFQQGGIYRLRISNIEGRPGLVLYPTLEVGGSSPRTAAYLAHAAIPIQFTQEDFDQVTSGHFVTKVIYVPDPQFQELALAGVDTIVSTRLDPGMDPITEADRRGSILAIVRMGNKDLEGFGVDPGLAAGAMPFGMGGAGGMDTSNYISGVTGPNYGMPYVGTNIGLPGPPHIPLGGPAGLQQYNIHNHTAMQIPGPTPEVNVHVRQKPGLSYPRPADRVLIQENTIRPPHFNDQPPSNMVYGDLNGMGGGMRGGHRGGVGCEDCPPGETGGTGLLNRIRR